MEADNPVESHNTYDTFKRGEEYVAISHNFPLAEGRGASESEAIDALDRRIIYLRDNTPNYIKQQIEMRKKKKVTCLCGYTAPDDTGLIYWKE